MKRLLAVPVISRTAFRGNLYLTDPVDDEPFSEEAEEILQRFASQAGIALDNAHIYARLEGLTLAEERLRLARELHDGQAQVLAFVSTKAQAVREYLNQGKIEEAKVQLEQLAVAAREIYADVREGILGLRTVVDKDHAFGDVLGRFLERWEDQSGIRVELQLSALPELPGDVELQLLRIIQEALANVRKHAAAEKVSLRLDSDDGRLRITLQDDGAGFDPDSPGRSRVPRFGLATMRERAGAIGAHLELTSAVGSGTRVEIRFPRQQEKRTPSIDPETL
jgi:signal transduction histidine kinase